MSNHKTSIIAMSWEDLAKQAAKESDRIQGATNSYALIRLFGQEEDSVKVTLYRDHHAWCPYCQKIWLWLELKQIPYKIKKVTMRCYGEKEDWYLKKVPSGMLPAIELDQNLITESDQILIRLEKAFGPLGTPLQNPRALKLRFLERQLFQSWCSWLCRPNQNNSQEKRAQERFQYFAKQMEKMIEESSGFYLDKTLNTKQEIIPGSIDVIFIPYLERMNASLAYYKGFNLRKEHPFIDKWFRELEKLDTYRGTQGDFHTHAHDLPPQMGGCWTNNSQTQLLFSQVIDKGQGLGTMETSFSSSSDSNIMNPQIIALSRVIKHREQLMRSNPLGSNLFDQPLRAALTNMITGRICTPNKGSAPGLRYLRDRISVPRDMPLLSARKFRFSLEETAKLDGAEEGLPLSTTNRFDQNPKPFLIDSYQNNQNFN